MPQRIPDEARLVAVVMEDVTFALGTVIAAAPIAISSGVLGRSANGVLACYQRVGALIRPVSRAAGLSAPRPDPVHQHDRSCCRRRHAVRAHLVVENQVLGVT